MTLNNQKFETRTTSSSSKFCQDSKNVRLFHVDSKELQENHVFVSQGGLLRSSKIFSQKTRLLKFRDFPRLSKLNFQWNTMDKMKNTKREQPQEQYCLVE